MFPELYLNFATTKLVGTSKIEGENAYEIKFSDNVSVFYSVKTGLKLKKEVTSIIDGEITKEEYYYRRYEKKNIVTDGRYKLKDGILFPTIIYRTPYIYHVSYHFYNFPFL